MSIKREPLSNATSNSAAGADASPGSAPSYRARPAVSPAFTYGRYQGTWDDSEQPFDFMLELSDVERAPAPKYAGATTVAPDEEGGQSNVVTKPPPPPLAGARHDVGERASVAPYNPDQDWDEVTPRATSVAAVLLSSPEQSDLPPASSDANPSSNTPSSSTPSSSTPATEPTGGRHPAPTPPAPATDETSASPAAFALAAPVPFPLTGPAPFPLPAQLTISSQPAAPSPNPAPSASSVPLRARAPSAPPSSSSPAAASGLAATPGTAESLTPVTRSEPGANFGYKFAPSFSIDNAPITTRGTYKREMEATVRERKPPSKWVPTVIAAFVLPFIGASMLTSWFESQRRATGATTEPALLAHAASPVPPHTDLPSANPPPDVAAVPGAAVAAEEPVILPQSLEEAVAPSADESATPSTASKPGVHPQGRAKSRRPLDTVDFGAGLTSESKASPASYRVKIPDEQNAPVLRKGAHNIPVNE